LSQAGIRSPLVGEEHRSSLKSRRDDLERGCVRRRRIDPVEERLQEKMLPVEQDLALVAEVAEEGALGQADGLRDLGNGRLLKPAAGEQLERRGLKTFAR